MSINQSLQNSKTQWSLTGVDFSFKKIFIDSLRFIYKFPEKFIILYLFNILFNFLIYKLSLSIKVFQYNNMLEIIAYLTLILFIFSIYIYGLLYSCTDRVLDVSLFFKSLYIKIWKLIFACIVFSIGFFITSFLIIPALYLIVAGLYFIPELLLNNKKIVESFRYSLNLVKGYLSISGYIFMAPIVGLVFIYTLSFYFPYSEFILIIISNIFKPLLISLFMVLYINFYLDLKLIKN